MKEESEHQEFERRGESLSTILGEGFASHVWRILLIVSVALLLRVYFSPAPAAASKETAGDPGWPADTSVNEAPSISPLSSRLLLLPVRGISPDDLQDSFNDRRAGGRQHHAIDIMAERSTPVVAVEDGTVAKIYSSRLGGLSVYQYDPTGRYVYYYAHLDRYAPGLSKGRPVRQGELIGYVGQTGNAESPHLHFAISDLGSDNRWWGGTPIDPYPLLRQARSY